MNYNSVGSQYFVSILLLHHNDYNASKCFVVAGIF